MSWRAPKLRKALIPHMAEHSHLLRTHLHGPGDTFEFGTDHQNKVDAQGAAHCYSRSRALNDPFHIGGLLFVDVQHEQHHINVQVFLTDAGEKALAALNKGYVWNTQQNIVDVPGTQAFWQEYLTRSSYEDRDLQELQQLDHPELAHLWPQAMYEIMRRSRVGSTWQDLS